MDAEFRRARHHSRLVTWLKIGLPLAALSIVGAGIGMTWIARSLPDDMSIASTSLEDGRIVMEDPRMSGVDKDNRPYSMIAERAVQSLTGGGIDLERIQASVSVSDDTTADIDAAAGTYNPETETLRLSDTISVETSNGMSMRLSAAAIDLAAGRLEGAGPVSITTPTQSIESGSLTVSDGGKRLSFGGRVKMTLMPDAEPEIEQQALKSD